MRNHITIGLRNATPSDIRKLKLEYESKGYIVQHVTKDLPYNGVLKCQLKKY